MRESRDCSYLVVDDRGRVVLSTPGNYSHATSYRRIVTNTLARFGREGLADLGGKHSWTALASSR